MQISARLEQIPAPGPEEIAARIKLARHYTLVLLRQGPAPRDDEQRNQRLQLEHLQHLMRLQTLGVLMINGPVLSDNAIVGVGIYAAPLEEARALAEADPKVVAGYLTVEAIPWMALHHDAQPA